jgi:RNA polymerase sigma factor for flagellar operon FliA
VRDPGRSLACAGTDAAQSLTIWVVDPVGIAALDSEHRMTATRTNQLAASQTDALWQRYRSTGDPEARAQLLQRYLGLVHHVARAIGARAPGLELDDLVSAGALGLVRALESFDLSRGLAFSTYAVQRIRGAILDDLRARDWTPRSVRAKGRRLAAAVAELHGLLGRAPEPREIAAVVGIDIATYWDWRAAVDGGVMVSFDTATTAGQRTAMTLEETLNDPDAPHPGHELAQLEQIASIRKAISRLPDKERTVLALYYYEELNLRQIAEVLHVTGSRISQIHTQALKRLGEMLTREAA